MMIIIGDVHGEFEKLKQIIDNQGILNRNFIQVGDFGLGFDSYEADVAALFDLNNYFEKRGSKLFIIRGNHDNPAFWKQGDLISLHSLKLVKDYTVLNIEGKNILFIGGGISVNRILLKDGVNYWNDEYVVTDENKLTFSDDIDITVTHVAPVKFWPKEHTFMTTQFLLKEQASGKTLSADLWEERTFMDKVLLRLCPKHWFYGHYHSNRIEAIKCELGGNTTAVCVGKLTMYDYRSGRFLND
jgi:UDP-2,3-diacylglucosamine pyrophosphatase LpxH